MALKTNYKDDIISSGILRKYNMIHNSDGTVSFEDVTEYSQVGDTFGGADINATNAAVNGKAEAQKIIDAKADLLANTQAGMIAGALAVKAAVNELTENTSSLAAKMPSKIYNPRGEIFNGSGVNIAGSGCATIIVIGSIAVVHFSLKIRVTDATSSLFTYGLNRDLFKNIDANIPNITPLTGGVMHVVDSDGKNKNTVTEWGGSFEARSQFWLPGRIYTDSGNFGGWTASMFEVGDIVSGVCFGTVE